MEKVSNVQVSQVMKLAAENLRALSEENAGLKEKVAFYHKRERAEKIASMMTTKGIEPALSIDEKVAGIMKREDLDVMEEAVSMSAPQMKIASVHEDGTVTVENDTEGDAATAQFAANLASLE